jgi:predicted acylesterase/phospholipase RssA
MNPASETALILSGGGSHGAFGLGVMQVLFAGRSPATGYRPLEADLYVGTSVGAFNAAVMTSLGSQSSLHAVQRLQDVWVSRIAQHPGQCENGVLRIRGNPFEYLDPDCLRDPARLAGNLASDSLVISGYILARSANFLASSAPLADRSLGFVNIGSFVDSGPYMNLLREVIVEEDIRRSPKLLSITATDWITGEAERFLNCDFHDNLGIQAVAASSAIPGVFPPVRIGNDLFVDGGLVENTPLSPAIDLGATEIHVIYLDPMPKYVPLMAEANTVDTLLRVYYVMLATKVNEDIETARWINNGLAALQETRGGQVSTEETRDFVRVASKILRVDVPYKKLVIHRYFPRYGIGSTFSMVDFQVANIVHWLEEGERVALLHDCKQSGCVL